MTTIDDADLSVPLSSVPDALRGGTVAIGNFDGVHRGHQVVLSAARAAGRPAMALTFEPHPRAFFQNAPLFRLTPSAVKARLIHAVGLDGVVVAPFDGHFSALSAHQFIVDVLVGALRARQVVVGEDFSFGAGRSGSVETLRAAGPHHGFEVEVVEGYADDGASGTGSAVISSTRVREFLASGDLAAAAQLLGYRYHVMAPVRHGEKRGREMGYPTANQALGEANGLSHGIYAVRAFIDGVWRGGVASFGRRPTFDNGRPLLETFVFDYAGDLYGKVLPVTLVAYLRPELKFASMDELVVQMDRDSQNARAALDNLAPLSALDEAVNFTVPTALAAAV